jgi:MFS family permease
MADARTPPAGKAEPPAADITVIGHSSDGIDGDEKVSKDEYRANFLAGFTAEEEKKIMRKVDSRLLVLCGLLFMIKQIDVNNAASVKVLSPGQPTNIMVQLNMSADEYNWVQSIYYISYIIFELPSNLLLKKTTPRLFQTRIVVLWGAVLACHAAATTSSGLLAARFFLGLAEAGLFPAIMTHCTSWYRTEEMGKPLMWTFGIFNFANIVGNILVYAMSFLDGRQGLSSWQWIFLLEGVATVAFGAAVYYWLPDYPRSERTAKWLTPREQEFVELRLASNAPVTSDAAFSAREALDVLKDPRLWGFMTMQVLLNIANFGLTWFLVGARFS